MGDINGNSMDSSPYEYSKSRGPVKMLVDTQYSSYAILLKEDGLQLHESDNNNDNDLYLSKGILSEDKIKLMEQYGSAVMTNSDLIEKIDEKEQNLRLTKRKNIETKPEKNTMSTLESIRNYCEEQKNGKLSLTIRKFNVATGKRRVSTQISRIMSYIKGRRNHVVLRENRNVKWQGILGLCVGVISFFLLCLLGQFVDDTKRNFRKNG